MIERHAIGRLGGQGIRPGLGRASAAPWWPWLVFAAACAVYVLLWVAAGRPFHPGGRLQYFDLSVYRGAGRLVLDGGSLYDTRIVRWAHFTYPPVAAVAFAPLVVVPLAVDEVLVTALSIGALVAVLWFALRLPAGRDAAEAERPRTGSWPLVALAAAAALWLEPITTTLGYGQINLVIVLLIVYDLSRRDTASTKGAMIGLAAGIKLTPLIFLLYLALSRRVRPALVGLAAFLATIGLAFVLVPSDAARYWGGLFLSGNRAGGCCTPSNQSLRGAILGVIPSLSGAPLIVLAVIVAIGGLTLAARASRRGDEATGFAICAVTGLLVSPVSWNHHWTLAVPALLVLSVSAYRRRSKLGLIAAAAMLAVGYSYLPEIVTNAYPGGVGLPPGWTLLSDSYVLIGVLVLLAAAAQECRVGAGGTRRR